MKESVEARQDSLSEAIALLLKAQAEKPKYRRRRPQPPAVTEDSSDESSDEEDYVPVPPKKRNRRGNKKKGTRPAAQPNVAPKYKIGKKYRPGMLWDPEWPRIMKDAYANARAEFHSTGTKEAIQDKVDGIKNALKAAKEANNADKEANLKKALAKWNKVLSDE